LGTATGYPRRVPKSRYTPPTPQMTAKISKVVELYRQQLKLEADYKAALADLAKPPPGDPEHVPIAYIAEQLDVMRKTVYRHLGRSMT
jgi:hypothetical protein